VFYNLVIHPNLSARHGPQKESGRNVRAMADAHVDVNIRFEIPKKCRQKFNAPRSGSASQEDWRLPSCGCQDEHSLPPSLVPPPSSPMLFLPGIGLLSMLLVEPHMLGVNERDAMKPMIAPVA
jgi:hypothetical protein